MGTYYNTPQEIADYLNNALLNLEGDFTIPNLKKAFKLVLDEQEEILDYVDYIKKAEKYD